MSDRVLILGGTGMLGHEAISRFTPHFEVHASVRDPELAAQYELPATLHAFDAYEPQALAELLGVGPIQPSSSTASASSSSSRRRLGPAGDRPQLALPAPGSQRCAEHKGCRLLHVSTDCVSPGGWPAGPSYAEEDTADARDLYGLTKLLGEVGRRA